MNNINGLVAAVALVLGLLFTAVIILALFYRRKPESKPVNGVGISWETEKGRAGKHQLLKALEGLNPGQGIRISHARMLKIWIVREVSGKFTVCLLASFLGGSHRRELVYWVTLLSMYEISLLAHTSDKQAFHACLTLLGHFSHQNRVFEAAEKPKWIND